MTEFAPFAPPPDAGPGAPGTVGDLYRIFGTDRKRDDAPAVAPATKLVVRKHDFSSAQTAKSARAVGAVFAIDLLQGRDAARGTLRSGAVSPVSRRCHECPCGSRFATRTARMCRRRTRPA